MTKVALYAVARDRKGEQETFRVGLPTNQTTADKRWCRLDDKRGGFNGQTARTLTVRTNRRNYEVRWLELRSVDRHGRGLGQDRHDKALIVPARNLKSAKR